MKGLRGIVTWVGAAGVVATVALLPAWQPTASAADQPARDERPISQKKAKFYELFVNSMDVYGEGRAVSCYDYLCKGPIASVLGVGDKYQLVRSVHIGGVFPSPCDEIMFGIPTQLLVARKAQTRWMRVSGPAGTPVGCFEGRLSIGVVVSPTATLELFAASLRGTTGLRPAMADPDINMESPASNARCNRPLHDEGYYSGRFNVRTLKAISDQLPLDLDPTQVRALLKALSRCPVEGTFEGTLDLGDEFDYCSIRGGQWWYDGLMKCKCRPTSVEAQQPPSGGK